MRSLASIQKIEAVRPIPDADAIEVVDVLGYNVVVKKVLDYRPGDLVVFFEIDSVLPDLPAFEEMLRGKPWSPRAAHLKTVKLRGQVSQGYVRHAFDIIPMDSTIGTAHFYDLADIVGTDVTDLLGVVKYEPPQPTDTAALAGHWIPGIPHTDEPRVQSNPKMLEALKGLSYIITEKADGMSGTFAYDAGGQFWSCSRNWRLNPNNNSPHNVVARNLGLEEKLYGTTLAVQGEVCGPGIQKNRLGFSEPTLLVFDIFDTNLGRYLSYPALRAVCDDLGLPTVRPLERGQSFEYDLAGLMALADGTYANGELREGIVVRHLYGTTLDRISFKAISIDYLLNGGN